MITKAAGEHLTTAAVWDRIHAYTESRGLVEPPNLFLEVDRLRGLGSSLTYATERLSRAPDTAPLGADFIADQVYARSSVDRALTPLYHIRFELTSQAGGIESTGTYTLEWPGELPATVGELRDEIAGYADDLSADYGVTPVAVGAIEVGAF